MEDIRCTICGEGQSKPLKSNGEYMGERLCPSHAKRLEEGLNREGQDPGEGKRRRWTINGKNLGLLTPYQENGLLCLILDLKKEHGTEMAEVEAEVEDKFYENLIRDLKKEHGTEMDED